MSGLGSLPNTVLCGRRTAWTTHSLEATHPLGELLDFADGPDVTAQYRAGDIRHCAADIGRIQGELGYAPQVALADGLRELLGWLRTQQADDSVEAAARELLATLKARNPNYERINEVDDLLSRLN